MGSCAFIKILFGFDEQFSETWKQPAWEIYMGKKLSNNIKTNLEQFALQTILVPLLIMRDC